MITVTAGTLALAPGLQTGFAASGGVGPYTFAVLAGGSGGSIHPTTGVYTAPPAISEDPKKAYDTIVATDTLLATGQAKLLVASPLTLVCDIIQRELTLDQSQVYLWDQKINIPKDERLYIAVGVMMVKPFGNTNFSDSSGAGLDPPRLT